MSAWLPLVSALCLIAGLLLTRPKSAQSKVLLIAVFAGVGAAFLRGALGVLPYLLIIVVAIAATAWGLIERRFESRRWWARAVDPIVLHPPFRDRWRVAAGGPDPRHNHHQMASDQYFAYDFLREAGESWEQEILAPCDGEVAWTQDRFDDAPPSGGRRDYRNPAGNYVSIETGRGYVILAHLKRGSVAVRTGAPIRVGDPIGLCGNSGNTRGPHLHVHAQDRAQIAVDEARGIPIAFVDAAGEAMILEYGDALP